MFTRNCDLVELMKDNQTFRRYQNCTVEFGEFGIKINCGKNKLFVSFHNILGYESINGKGVIFNMEVYCSNTF